MKKTRIFLVAIGFALVAFFQNCMPLKDFETSPFGAGALVQSSNVSFSMNATNVRLDSSGKVTEISNTMGSNSLLPDQVGLATISNGWISVAPQAVATRLRSTQLGTFTSASIAVLTKTTSRGIIVSLNNGDLDNQPFEIRLDDSGIFARVRFSSGETDKIEKTVALPATEYAIIVATFGPTADAIQLYVNGVKAGDAVVSGSSSALYSASRYLVLGSPVAGQNSYFRELFLFNRVLTIDEIGSLTAYIADLNGYKGITSPGGGGTPETVDPLFASAKAVIDSKCLGCHAEWTGISASRFVQLGLVVAGSPASSKLYYRLQGSTQGPGTARTMPMGGSISAGDVDKIAAWITSQK